MPPIMKGDEMLVISYRNGVQFHCGATIEATDTRHKIFDWIAVSWSIHFRCQSKILFTSWCRVHRDSYRIWCSASHFRCSGVFYTRIALKQSKIHFIPIDLKYWRRHDPCSVQKFVGKFEVRRSTMVTLMSIENTFPSKIYLQISSTISRLSTP